MPQELSLFRDNVRRFVADTNQPGFRRGRNLEKIDLHEGDTSKLFFEDLRVPKAAIPGELDKGFLVLMNELQRERLSFSVAAVATAEGVLSETTKSVKEHEAFGKPLAILKNTRLKIAKMVVDIRVNRSIGTEYKLLLLEGELDSATTTMAMHSTTEMQGRVVDGCLQMLGSYG